MALKPTFSILNHLPALSYPPCLPAAVFGQFVLGYFVNKYRKQYLITMVIGSVIGCSSVFMGVSGLMRTIQKVGVEGLGLRIRASFVMCEVVEVDGQWSTFSEFAPPQQRKAGEGCVALNPNPKAIVGSSIGSMTLQSMPQQQHRRWGSSRESLKL
jgi:hypothetical protein